MLGTGCGIAVGIPTGAQRWLRAALGPYLDGIATAPKILWLKERYPAVMRQARRHLLLPDDQVLTASFDTNLLNGVEVISGQADLVGKDGISQTRQPFKAIPYYAWANRGKGEMAVWLADSVAALQSGKK